jgi:hypothetical protein
VSFAILQICFVAIRDKCLHSESPALDRILNGRYWRLLLQKLAATDWAAGPFVKSRALTRWPRRLLRNSDATRCTVLERVAVARPTLRAAVDSERWRAEQIHPVRLVDHAVAVDRASGCASNVRTHLDLLALAPRLLKALGANERPGNVSGMLMDVARDLA